MDPSSEYEQALAALRRLSLDELRHLLLWDLRRVQTEVADRERTRHGDQKCAGASDKSGH